MNQRGVLPALLLIVTLLASSAVVGSFIGPKDNVSEQEVTRLADKAQNLQGQLATAPVPGGAAGTGSFEEKFAAIQDALRRQRRLSFEDQFGAIQGYMARNQQAIQRLHLSPAVLGQVNALAGGPAGGGAGGPAPGVPGANQPGAAAPGAVGAAVEEAEPCPSTDEEFAVMQGAIKFEASVLKPVYHEPARTICTKFNEQNQPAVFKNDQVKLDALKVEVQGMGALGKYVKAVLKARGDSTHQPFDLTVDIDLAPALKAGLQIPDQVTGTLLVTGKTASLANFNTGDDLKIPVEISRAPWMDTKEFLFASPRVRFRSVDGNPAFKKPAFLVNNYPFQVETRVDDSQKNGCDLEFGPVKPQSSAATLMEPPSVLVSDADQVSAPTRCDLETGPEKSATVVAQVSAPGETVNLQRDVENADKARLEELYQGEALAPTVYAPDKVGLGTCMENQCACPALKATVATLLDAFKKYRTQLDDPDTLQAFEESYVNPDKPDDPPKLTEFSLGAVVMAADFNPVECRLDSAFHGLKLTPGRIQEVRFVVQLSDLEKKGAKAGYGVQVRDVGAQDKDLADTLQQPWLYVKVDGLKADAAKNTVYTFPARVNPSSACFVGPEAIKVKKAFWPEADSYEELLSSHAMQNVCRGQMYAMEFESYQDETGKVISQACANKKIFRGSFTSYIPVKNWTLNNAWRVFWGDAGGCILAFNPLESMRPGKEYTNGNQDATEPGARPNLMEWYNTVDWVNAKLEQLVMLIFSSDPTQSDMDQKANQLMAQKFDEQLDELDAAVLAFKKLQEPEDGSPVDFASLEAAREKITRTLADLRKTLADHPLYEEFNKQLKEIEALFNTSKETEDAIKKIQSLIPAGSQVFFDRAHSTHFVVPKDLEIKGNGGVLIGIEFSGQTLNGVKVKIAQKEVEPSMLEEELALLAVGVPIESKNGTNQSFQRPWWFAPNLPGLTADVMVVGVTGRLLGGGKASSVTGRLLKWVQETSVAGLSAVGTPVATALTNALDAATASTTALQDLSAQLEKSRAELAQAGAGKAAADAEVQALDAELAAAKTAAEKAGAKVEQAKADYKLFRKNREANAKAAGQSVERQEDILSKELEEAKAGYERATAKARALTADLKAAGRDAAKIGKTAKQAREELLATLTELDDLGVRFDFVRFVTDDAEVAKAFEDLAQGTITRDAEAAVEKRLAELEAELQAVGGEAGTLDEALTAATERAQFTEAERLALRDSVQDAIRAGRELQAEVAQARQGLRPELYAQLKKAREQLIPTFEGNIGRMRQEVQAATDAEKPLLEKVQVADTDIAEAAKRAQQHTEKMTAAQKELARLEGEAPKEVVEARNAVTGAQDAVITAEEAYRPVTARLANLNNQRIAAEKAGNLEEAARLQAEYEKLILESKPAFERIHQARTGLDAVKKAASTSVKDAEEALAAAGKEAQEAGARWKTLADELKAARDAGKADEVTRLAPLVDKAGSEAAALDMKLSAAHGRLSWAQRRQAAADQVEAFGKLAKSAEDEAAALRDASAGVRAEADAATAARKAAEAKLMADAAELAKLKKEAETLARTLAEREANLARVTAELEAQIEKVRQLHGELAAKAADAKALAADVEELTQRLEAAKASVREGEAEVQRLQATAQAVDDAAAEARAARAAFMASAAITAAQAELAKLDTQLTGLADQMERTRQWQGTAEAAQKLPDQFKKDLADLKARAEKARADFKEEQKQLEALQKAVDDAVSAGDIRKATAQLQAQAERVDALRKDLQALEAELARNVKFEGKTVADIEKAIAGYKRVLTQTEELATKARAAILEVGTTLQAVLKPGQVAIFELRGLSKYADGADAATQFLVVQGGKDGGVRIVSRDKLIGELLAAGHTTEEAARLAARATETGWQLFVRSRPEWFIRYMGLKEWFGARSLIKVLRFNGYPVARKLVLNYLVPGVKRLVGLVETERAVKAIRTAQETVRAALEATRAGKLVLRGAETASRFSVHVVGKAVPVVGEVLMAIDGLYALGAWGVMSAEAHSHKSDWNAKYGDYVMTFMDFGDSPKLDFIPGAFPIHQDLELDSLQSLPIYQAGLKDAETYWLEFLKTFGGAADAKPVTSPYLAHKLNGTSQVFRLDADKEHFTQKMEATGIGTRHQLCGGDGGAWVDDCYKPYNLPKKKLAKALVNAAGKDLQNLDEALWTNQCMQQFKIGDPSSKEYQACQPFFAANGMDDSQRDSPTCSMDDSCSDTFVASFEIPDNYSLLKTLTQRGSYQVIVEIGDYRSPEIVKDLPEFAQLDEAARSYVAGSVDRKVLVEALRKAKAAHDDFVDNLQILLQRFLPGSYDPRTEYAKMLQQGMNRSYELTVDDLLGKEKTGLTLLKRLDPEINTSQIERHLNDTTTLILRVRPAPGFYLDTVNQGGEAKDAFGATKVIIGWVKYVPLTAAEIADQEIPQKFVVVKDETQADYFFRFNCMPRVEANASQEERKEALNNDTAGHTFSAYCPDGRVETNTGVFVQ